MKGKGKKKNQSVRANERDCVENLGEIAWGVGTGKHAKMPAPKQASQFSVPQKCSDTKRM